MSSPIHAPNMEQEEKEDTGNVRHLYMSWDKNILDIIDKGIRPAVAILNNHGFTTFESCEGGNGHCFTEPTVRFYGSEFDLLRAYDICRSYGLNVYEAKRVFIKEDVYRGDESKNAMPIGIAWANPFNELVFAIHVKTGTIYLPD